MNFVVSNIDRYDGIFFNKKKDNIFNYKNVKLIVNINNKLKKSPINKQFFQKKIKGILKNKKDKNYVKNKKRIKFKDKITVHKISFKDKSHISTNDEILKGKRPDDIDNIISQMIISILNIPNYRKYRLESLIPKNICNQLMVDHNTIYNLILSRLISIYFHLDVYKHKKIIYGHKSYRVPVKQKGIIKNYIRYQTVLLKKLKKINRFYKNYIKTKRKKK